MKSQAERLKVATPLLRSVWEYLQLIAAISVTNLYGLNALAQISVVGVQLCEAPLGTTVAGEGGRSTTITADQVVIARGDAHHIQYGTVNVQQEGLDLEAANRLVQAVRELIEEHVVEPTERSEALSDLQEVEAVAKERAPGIIARAKEALARLCNRARPRLTRDSAHDRLERAGR